MCVFFFCFILITLIVVGILTLLEYLFQLKSTACLNGLLHIYMYMHQSSWLTADLLMTCRTSMFLFKPPRISTHVTAIA